MLVQVSDVAPSLDLEASMACLPISVDIMALTMETILMALTTVVTSVMEATAMAGQVLATTVLVLAAAGDGVPSVKPDASAARLSSVLEPEVAPQEVPDPQLLALLLLDLPPAPAASK